jgi:hypothetical protein
VQSSRAKIVGLANADSDMTNSQIEQLEAAMSNSLRDLRDFIAGAQWVSMLRVNRAWRASDAAVCDRNKQAGTAKR